MKQWKAIFAILIITLISIPAAAVAQEEEEEDDCTAYVSGIVGTAEYRESEDDDWEAAELDMCLMVGDLLRTLEDSAMALQFGEEVQIRLNASSNMTVSSMEEDSDVPNQVDLDMGEMWSEMTLEEGEELDFQVGTPSGVVAVRGTEFNVAVDEEGKSKVNVLAGAVAIFNDLGEVLAEAGMAAELLKGVMPGEPFEFDVAAFRKNLNAWKDQISIGAIKEKLTKKLDEKKKEIMDAPKKKLKGKFGF